MESEEQTRLRCVGLQVGYRGRPILPPIDLRLGAGEFWVVLGRNGSGKTTWFRTILGLQPPVAGRIARPSGTAISYIPQHATLDPLFPLSARDVVRLGAERGGSFLRWPAPGQARVEPALDRVGALDIADRPYRDLSEGQKQRVLLARLAASEPDVALLDEPTSAMDVIAERNAFAFLDGLRHERDTSVVVVSHYMDIAREFATHAIFLDRETETVFVGPLDQVLEHPQYRRTYGDVRHA